MFWTITDLRLFENLKNTTLENFLNSDFEETLDNLQICIQEYNKLKETGNMDNTDLFFVYSLYALSYEKTKQTEKAIIYYKKVLDLKIDNFVMDDLWVYFARWLAVSRIWDGSWNNDVDYTDVHKELEKWFKVFPDNEEDLYDDVTYNTRLNIISKFAFLIHEAFITFEWLNFWVIKNSDWDIINFWIFIWWELNWLFWYKVVK